MSYFSFTYSAVSKLLTVFNLFNLIATLDGTVNIAKGKSSHAMQKAT